MSGAAPQRTLLQTLPTAGCDVPLMRADRAAHRGVRRSDQLMQMSTALCLVLVLAVGLAAAQLKVRKRQ